MIFLHVTFTLWAVALFCRAARERFALAPARRADGPLFTFVVDPLTFLAVGFFSVLVSLLHLKGRRLTQDEFRARMRFLDRAFVLFVVGFWTVEVLTYFDLLNLHHGMYPGKTGNWFMWNGYLDLVGIPDIVDTTVPTTRSIGMNALAFVLLLAQLPFLIYGRAMGYSVGWILDRNSWSRPKPARSDERSPAGRVDPAAE